MHLDKAKKRIAKKVKMGFKGYPQISIAYFGETIEVATVVAIQLVMEAGAEVQEQRFTSQSNVREDEIIQSAIVKIMERTDAKSVIEIDGTAVLA